MKNFELTSEEVIALYALTMGDKAQDKENNTSYLMRLMFEEYLEQSPVHDNFNALIEHDRLRSEQ